MERPVNFVYVLEHHCVLESVDSIKTIGVFSSLSKANEIQFYYQNRVQGFCSYPSGFQLHTIRCEETAHKSNLSKVFLIVSWKQDGDEEKEVRYEKMFYSKRWACAAVIWYKIAHLFRKCIIEQYTLDNPEWKEGFTIECF